MIDFVAEHRDPTTATVELDLADQGRHIAVKDQSCQPCSAAKAGSGRLSRCARDLCRRHGSRACGDDDLVEETSAIVTVSVNVPRIPRYAPVPEPARTSTGTVALTVPEQEGRSVGQRLRDAEIIGKNQPARSHRVPPWMTSKPRKAVDHVRLTTG